MSKSSFTIAPILLLIIFSFQVSAQNNWEVLGPGAGSDLHFMAMDPVNADIIYVGGDIEGIFKTTDFGLTWKCVNNNLAQTNYGGGQYWINDLQLDPSDNQTIYICTEVGLFKSENAADSWTLLYPSSLTNEDDIVPTGSVAVDPSDQNTIYLGFGYSVDGTSADFKAFEPFTGTAGFYKSSDGGANWSEIGQSISDGKSIHSVVVNPLNSQQIFIATSNGFFRSDDGGTSWTEKTENLPHSSCHRLLGKLFGSDFKLYLSVKTIGTIGNAASFSGGLFTSENNGDDWTDITGDLPKYDSDDNLFYDYWKFDIHPTDPDIIYTGTVRGSGYADPGIYKTTDGGNSWTHLHAQNTDSWLNSDWFDDPYIFDIKVNPADPNKIAACWDWVETSSDAGSTWNQRFTASSGGAWSGTGLELMNTDCIAFHPTDQDQFYIGYDDMGLFRTDDSGESFFRLDEQMDPVIGSLSDVDAIKDIQIDNASGDLYISRFQGSQGGYNEGYTSGGIVFSNDLGVTQTDISNGLPSGRCDLVIDQTSGSSGNRTLYTAVYHHGVYKSSNSGTSWESINTGLGSENVKAWEIAISPTDNQLLYLGMNSSGTETVNLYKSENGGDSWGQVTSFPGGDILALLIDGSSNVYVSMTDNFDWHYTGGLYRSTDGGTSWNKIHDHPRIIDIDINPNNPDMILAAGQPFYKPDAFGGSIDISSDGGTTWDDYSLGMGHTFINFAKFSPHENSKIFAGTAGGGIWALDITATGVAEQLVPENFRINQNYPNPFNPGTIISYTIYEANNIIVSIYNNVGEKITELVNEYQSPGTYNVEWLPESIASGVYYYIIRSGNISQSLKMIYLK